jgi:hypothetical protein
MTVRATACSPAALPGAVLFSWVGVAVGITLNDGRYSGISLAFVLVGALLAALVVLQPGRLSSFTARPYAGQILAALGVMAATTLIVLTPLSWHRRYGAQGDMFVVSQVFSAFAALTAVVAVFRAGRADRMGTRSHSARWFTAVVLLAVAAGVSMLLSAAHPQIDVFYLLQGSTQGLWHGADMYRQQWGPSRAGYPAGGLFDVYPYLPGTSVLLAPFRLLLGDVRYGEILATVIAAVTVRSIARQARTPAVLMMLAPLLLLVMPKVAYAQQQAWTEPLLVALLAGMVWATQRGHGALAVLCFAAALASKQHIVLLLPLAACWPAFGVRKTVVAAGTALLAVIPWIAAGPADFWHDAVTTNLNYPVLNWGLDLPAAASRHGYELGFGLTVLALVTAYAAAIRGLRRRPDAWGFATSGALVLLVLDLTNKQSFFNHYTLPMGLLAIALAACGPVAEAENAVTARKAALAPNAVSDEMSVRGGEADEHRTFEDRGLAGERRLIPEGRELV